MLVFVNVAMMMSMMVMLMCSMTSLRYQRAHRH